MSRKPYVKPSFTTAALTSEIIAKYGFGEPSKGTVPYGLIGTLVATIIVALVLMVLIDRDVSARDAEQRQQAIGNVNAGAAEGLAAAHAEAELRTAR